MSMNTDIDAFFISFQQRWSSRLKAQREDSDPPEEFIVDMLEDIVKEAELIRLIVARLPLPEKTTLGVLVKLHDDLTAQVKGLEAVERHSSESRHHESALRAQVRAQETAQLVLRVKRAIEELEPALPKPV